MNKTVLITGAGGMLAQKVSNQLKAKGYQVRFLSRNPKSNEQFKWDIEKAYIDEKAFDNLTHIVHLAGASVGEKKWTKPRKKEIIDSRVETAKLLNKYVLEKGLNLEAFISASGISFYGKDTKDLIVDENSPKGDGFLADVVELWEKAADDFSKHSKRVVKLRFGVILDKNSGMIQKLAPLFNLGLGSAVGSGKQFLPWVHAEDACNSVFFAIENEELNGVFNIVAEEAITNQEFSRAFAKSMKKPFFLPPVPGFVLKITLGEMAEMVLGGNRVSNLKSLQNGFTYEFDNIKKALNHI
ncbi:MAG: TIGR01777 family oxidoreductase [Cytophagales bacterium]